MDRVERLTNLVTFLLNRPNGATLTEIGDEVPGWPANEESRRRAFERDKRVLRDEGVPLVEDKGRYRIPPEHFYLPDLDLTEDEQVALRLAVAAVRVGGGSEPAGLALHKLALDAGGGPFDDAAPAIAALDEQPALPALHAAVRSRSVVRFVYGSPPVDREVEPSLLFFRDGYWYLACYDRGRAAMRTFRVDRVEGELEVLDEHFEPHRAPPTTDEAMLRQPWLWGDETEPEEAVVEVDAILAEKAIARVGDRGTYERNDDGSVTLRLPIANRHEFRTLVVGMVDHAVVLEPAALRAEIVAWLDAFGNGVRA